MQKRETRKNYIGLLNEAVDEQPLVEASSPADRRVKEYFRNLMTVMLNRGRSEVTSRVR
jgi:hypothetical protein